MDLPPRGILNEMPTKPFGLFVPPSVEQLIGRRTLESEKELVSGKRRSIKEIRAQIPADGGRVMIPGEGDEALRLGSSGTGEGDYDTMTMSATTDGQSSHASINDYRSSKTSFLDDGSTVTEGRQQSRTTLNEPEPEPEAAAAALPPSAQVEVHRMEPPVTPAAEMRTSPSQHSDYDNLNSSVAYEQNLDRTLESLGRGPGAGYEDQYRAQAVTIVNVNGFQGGHRAEPYSPGGQSVPPANSFMLQESHEVSEEFHVEEARIIQINGPSSLTPPSTSPPPHQGSPPLTNPHQMSPQRMSPQRMSPKRTQLNGGIEGGPNGYPDFPSSPGKELHIEVRMRTTSSSSNSPPHGSLPHSTSNMVDGLPLRSPTRGTVVHSCSTGGIMQQVTTPTDEQRTIYRSSIYL